MSRFSYRFFDEYVFRTPLFSCRKFLGKTEKLLIESDDLKLIFSDSAFQEAVLLASPYLHKEMLQWLNSEKAFSSKEFQKLKNTLLKYYSRMSTRCTPFGLFSQVGLGVFDDEKEFSSSETKIIRDTKLDMHFLVALSQNLTKKPEIKNQLLFFPNNSIYKIGTKIRYIEYEYTKGKRDYIISSVPLSKELDSVLGFLQKGRTVGEIVDILINEEITREDAIGFIDELIDNQIIVSELEPNVSGNDFLEKLIATLNRIGSDEEAEVLKLIQGKLIELDQNIGNSISGYKEIENFINRSFDIEYEQKFLFQTDLYSDEKKKLPLYWQEKIKKGISFLNKITPFQKESHFEKFKNAFYERFEAEEVSLAYALDTEIGIGYRQDLSSKGLHPYLEDLNLPHSKKDEPLKIHLDAVQQVLNEKLQNTLTNNQDKIELSDDDFKDIEECWNDLPDTFSCMAEIISENENEKLFLDGGGGSSAANLLGRFCSEKSDIHSLTKRITEKESELNAHYILAEIIHLPETRTGNVIRRPTLRSYEIPFLAQSVLPEENQILIEDLYISLKNNKIILRSKKLNKEIRPYLTNAHNYLSNSLPVYHFLCDIHSQNVRTGVYFSWGDLKHLYHFLPRVEYQNIIISKARWKITEKEINYLLLYKEDGNMLLNEIKEWRTKRKIPQWIQWVELDNRLTINLENYDLLLMFIHSIKHRKVIIIEEFLYNEHEDFRYEFIFPMYKEKALK